MSTTPDFFSLRQNILNDDLDILKQQFNNLQNESISLEQGKKLIITAIYSHRLNILEFLLSQFPNAIKRNGPLDFGDIINLALEYDKNACLTILKFKLEQAKKGENEWNQLHTWVVERWNQKQVQIESENTLENNNLNNSLEKTLDNLIDKAQNNQNDSKVNEVKKEKKPFSYYSNDESSSEEINDSSESEDENVVDEKKNDSEIQKEVENINTEEEKNTSSVQLPEEYILKNKHLNGEQDCVGWTPLHLASFLQDDEACKILIENDSPLSVFDFDQKRDPVQIVAAYGDANTLKFFIESGANVLSKNKRGESIFYTSIKYGNTDTLSYLLTQSFVLEEINSDRNGNIPILAAIKYSRPLVVKMLIDAGADPNRIINSDMMTCLHYIASLQYCRDAEKEIATILITYGGATVDARDRNGATPLHYSFLYSRVEIAQLLLKHNAIFTQQLIDLIRSNEAMKKIYLQLKQKKLTEHTAALIYSADTLSSYQNGIAAHTTTYTNIGELYVFGGIITKNIKNKPVSRYTNKLLRFYSTLSENDHGSWTEIEIPDQVKKRAFHSSVYFNGNFWFYGGKNPEVLDLFECFSLVTQSWINLTSKKDENGDYISTNYPGPLFGHSAVISYRKDYTIEDLYENADIDVIRKRILAFKDSRDPLMLQGWADAPNVVPDSQKMIIFGGENQNGTQTDNVWEYNFTTNEWILRPNGPPARMGHTTVYDHHKNSIIIFGGYDGTKHLNDIYDYSLWDYENNPLTSTTASPPPRRGHASILVSNKMWIFGGTNDLNVFNDLWYFNLENHSWNKVDISSKFAPRFNFTINFINEKQIVAFGGENLFSKNLSLIHLPEHHKLHERIFSNQPEEEEGEFSDEESAVDNEQDYQEHIDNTDEDIVRDAPSTLYF